MFVSSLRCSWRSCHARAGRRCNESASHTRRGSTGPTIDCVDSGDWDGDRLPNGVETNAGQFLHAANTGTNPHEVGHNLGLWHGGDECTNYIWNYNSVMNYLCQFPGVDDDCVLGGDDVLDYSRGQRAALNENALVEANGVCGGVGIDWNGNSSLDPGTVTVDINGDSYLSTLTDHDDWSNLYFTGAAAGAGAGTGPSRSSSSTTTITEQPVPLSAQD